MRISVLVFGLSAVAEAAVRKYVDSSHSASIAVSEVSGPAAAEPGATEVDRPEGEPNVIRPRVEPEFEVRLDLAGVLDVNRIYEFSDASIPEYDKILLGDLKRAPDCEVNQWDMHILIENMGTDAGFLGGDLNEDGTVDDKDLAILLDNFGAECQPLFGDLRARRDCIVDALDLEIILYNYGKRVSPQEGDLDRNGVVAFNDLILFIGEWGKVCRHIVGDLNRDCVVGPRDLAILRRNWGQNAGIRGGDLNEDGVVDEEDLKKLIRNWGKRCRHPIGDLIHKRDCVVDEMDVSILKSNLETNAGFAGGDLNEDGIVDKEDLELILKHVGDTCSPLVGDLGLRRDCEVNEKDLVTILWNFGEKGVGVHGGDLNRNGVVDVRDVAILLGRLGWTCDKAIEPLPIEPAPIEPEPIEPNP